MLAVIIALGLLAALAAVPGIARVVIVVMGGFGVVIALVTASPSFGDALWLLAVVLMFLPASNLFFDARATVRTALRANKN